MSTARCLADIPLGKNLSRQTPLGRHPQADTSGRHPPGKPPRWSPPRQTPLRQTPPRQTPLGRHPLGRHPLGRHPPRWPLQQIVCILMEYILVLIFTNIPSGGSRILPRGCANSQKCYYFSFFLPKTASKLKNLDNRGGGASLVPPLDPSMSILHIMKKTANT